MTEPRLRVAQINALRKGQSSLVVSANHAQLTELNAQVISAATYWSY